MVNEQMLEDIKYTNAMTVYFQISVVHIPIDELQIRQNQESIEYIFIRLNGDHHTGHSPMSLQKSGNDWLFTVISGLYLMYTPFS
jgi:hypothetical protein